MTQRIAPLIVALVAFQAACADDMSLAGPSNPRDIGQLQVWIGDSSGMSLPGSRVLLTSIDDTARPITHTANAASDGMVMLDVGLHGRYKLMVLSIGYVLHEAEIDIHPGATASFEISLRPAVLVLHDCPVYGSSPL